MGTVAERPGTTTGTGLTLDVVGTKINLGSPQTPPEHFNLLHFNLLFFYTPCCKTFGHYISAIVLFPGLGNCGLDDRIPAIVRMNVSYMPHGALRYCLQLWP